MDEHGICRSMLAHIMKDVRKHASKEIIAAAWTWKDGDTGRQEFQLNDGPVEVYWYGSACCGWTARVKGWRMYLRKLGVDGYKA